MPTSSKKRRLIFLWPYVEWGGAQVYMMAIMKEAREDWDIVVALPRASSLEMIGFLEQIGVKYDLFDFQTDSRPATTLVRKLARQWSRISNEFAILKYLRRFELRESVLHIEISPWQSWQFLTLLSLIGANVFVTMHNAITGSKWREVFWKLRMQFVSRLRGFHIFASNEDTKNKIKHLVARKFWDNIAVTYTCVDPVQIAAVLKRNASVTALRERHGISENAFVILCVGQFVDRKGRWVFLDAAKEFVDQLDIKFVWLTPAEPNETDLERIKAYGLTNFELKLSPSVGSSREEVLAFFRIADVFALPSYVEGLPIALLEAMALGIPSISTNVYATPEAVKNHETGILIEPGDPSSLAAAIRELKENEPLRTSLAANGSRFVLENFDERVASRKAIEKYEECFRNDA